MDLRHELSRNMILISHRLVWEKFLGLNMASFMAMIANGVKRMRSKRCPIYDTKTHCSRTAQWYDLSIV
jgi:hypothetical protein